MPESCQLVGMRLEQDSPSWPEQGAGSHLPRCRISRLRVRPLRQVANTGCHNVCGWGLIIDISEDIEFPYKKTTCAVMYTMGSALICSVVIEVRNTIFPISLHSFHFIGGLGCRPFLKEHSLNKAERRRKIVYVIWNVCGIDLATGFWYHL
jgi:hypothetical protein